MWDDITVRNTEPGEVFQRLIKEKRLKIEQ